MSENKTCLGDFYPIILEEDVASAKKSFMEYHDFFDNTIMKLYSLLLHLLGFSQTARPREVNVIIVFVLNFIFIVATTRKTEFSGPPLPDRPFFSVWNVPSQNCATKWNISLNLSSFDIVANKGMSWHGKFMNIFYQGQIGLYPYFDSQGIAVNGGLPQLADFEKHFEKVEADIKQYIPDPDFRGIAVIDWESWRPVFDRNWDSKLVYRNKSFILAQQRYPSLPANLTWEIAKIEFEAAARKLMEGTLLFAKALRPKALWGYYGFPRCYNHGKPDWKCSNTTKKLNDQLTWLFESSAALFPSIYISATRLYKTEEFVKYQIDEAFRVAQNTGNDVLTIFPYIRFVYAQSEIFLNEEDIFATIGQSAEMATGGTVIWGSTTDCSSKLICSELQSYTHQLLGPLVRNLTQVALDCSSQFCTAHGRCEFQLTSHIRESGSALFKSLKGRWRFVRCLCYAGWSGENCQQKS